jgi:hypothetical protein
MRCQFCKSSDHTLKNCNSLDSHKYLVKFLLFHMTRPFHISEQITFLKKYTKPQLAVVCKQLSTKFTGNKDQLMFFIIEKMFKNRTSHDMISTLTNENYVIINDQYLYLYQLGQSNNHGLFHSRLINMFENFYRVFQHNENLYYKDSQSHLKKLEIHVSVDESLQNQECSICFEIKTNTKLGCLHEYCVDCVFGTAKVRTKSFINCAICRAEINELKVSSLEIKNELLQKISSI